MIKFRPSRHGVLTRRSMRSYVLNGAMRLFVRPRFKSPPMSASEMRRFLVTYVEPRARFSEHADIAHDRIGDLPVQWIRPKNHDSDTLLLYLHGGAFIMETPRAHGAFLSRLVESSGMTAVMPSYRLAPEHPFPAAVEDCMSMYRWIIESGYDPAKVILAGDSAGGNLTLVTLQQARKEGLPMPACAVMVSPGMDLSGTESQRVNASRDPMFNEHAIHHVITYYLQGQTGLTQDARVSPLKGDFSGLPPLFFMAGSTEIFRDCSVLSANKAREAGVDVSCTIWNGMSHCFPIMFPGVLPEADSAIEEILEFIGKHAKPNQPG